MVTRIRHPHVVQTLDVVSHGGELLLVMDYVEGESLSRLLRALAAKQARIPATIAVAIAVGVLEGLHAAHEARSDGGELLNLVHRDVSPQNVLVGTDGVARLIDFGVAKAVGRSRETESGQVKGKLSYMSPEQVRGEDIDRRTDVFALSIVLWEMLTGRRLFAGKNEGDTIFQVLGKEVASPSTLAPHVSRELEASVMRGLSRAPEERFPTALEMAHALEAATMMATPREISKWVRETAGEALAERARIVARVERATPLASARTEPALEPSPDAGAGPQSIPTRALAPESEHSSPRALSEPGTLTQASNISISAKRPDATRALWVVLGVVALGMVIGGMALARRESESAPPADSVSLAAPLVHQSATPPPPAQPSASTVAEPTVPPAASSAPTANRGVAPPRAHLEAVKPAVAAPAASKPRSALYGRE